MSKIKENKMTYIGTIFMIVLILSGIVKGFMESLKRGGWNNYRNLFRGQEFYDSLFLSLKLGIITTVLVGLLSLLLIYFLYMISNKYPIKRVRILKNIIISPILFPYIVAAFCMGMLLMQSGILGRIAYRLGIISQMSEFPQLVNDKYGIGIVIGYLWKTIPFMILILYPVLEKVKDKWYDLGNMYNASEKQFFFYVVFPMMKNAIMTGLFIVFAYSFSAFELPYFLGQTYPKTLSVYSYLRYAKGPFEERGEALAANFILTLIVIMIGTVACYFYNKLKQREG